jgi:hypothetical protein
MTLANRFWSRVDSSGECWLWLGERQSKGYGYITTRARKMLVHRLSWELANVQEVPREMLVCHRCDVPSCVRPEHLFIGTARDNSADMTYKGRHARGARFVIINGERVYAAEAARRVGISRHLLCQRLRKGWPVEIALQRPVAAVAVEALEERAYRRTP